MGVRGLYKYINEVPGSFRTVNILLEIQKYQSQHGRNPVILINLWTMSINMKSDAKDVIVGYRLNEIEKKFEDFLQNLKNAGAELIFVFKKTELKKDYDFIAQEEIYCKDSKSFIDVIRAKRSFKDINEHYANVQRADTWFRFPLNQAVMLVMCQVAKRYGKLHGMDTIKSLHSHFQVQLANEHNAFAILGLDTHYIFFEGSWKFWSDADLDLDLMTVRQYDKELILRFMNLTPEKAPLFATLAGGLNSSEENVKKVVHYFKPWNKQLINDVAVFVNRQQFPLIDCSITNVILQIFGHCSPQVFNDFKETMRSFDLKENMKTASNVDKDIMDMTKNDYANLAEEILENATIFISPAYIDLSGNEVGVHDLVIPFIARTSGILLKNKADQKPRTALVKKSFYEGFNEVKVQPIIPSFDIPQLKTLISGSLPLDEKFKLLQWLSGLELTVDDLKLVPNEFIVDIVICLHLIKNKAMTVSEAECLMQSIIDVKDNSEDEEKYPSIVSDRAFRLGFLYMKLFFFVHSCIAAIGLKIFQNDLKFDGRHFQLLFEEENFDADSPINLKIAFKNLLAICSRDSEPFEYPADGDDDEEGEGEDDPNIDPSLKADGDLNEQDQKIERLFKEGNFQDCLRQLLSAEKNEKLRNDNRNYKIECLLKLNKLDEAGKILKLALKKTPRDSNLLFLQGLKFYFESDMKNSIVKFDEASKISSWMIKAQVQRELAKKMLNIIYEGFKEMKENKFKEARDIFTEALTVDSSNKNFSFLMLYNLGMANMKLIRFNEAFDNYNEALRIKENDASCLVKRADIHFKLKEFEDCIIDCEESLKLQASESAKKLLAMAKSQLTTVTKKSSHEILGVARGASKSEAKKAFYKLSLLYHVDKHPLAASVEKLKLNRKFREMKAAYDTFN